MKATLIALILCALAGNTVAQTPAPTCKAQATDKKLSGAALTSFMTPRGDAAAVPGGTAASRPEFMADLL
jgi:hypothetical protein